MTWVPPWRSRASFGVKLAFSSDNEPTAISPVSPTSKARSHESDLRADLTVFEADNVLGLTSS